MPFWSVLPLASCLDSRAQYALRSAPSPLLFAAKSIDDRTLAPSAGRRTPVG